jgi:hypothetical protein
MAKAIKKALESPAILDTIGFTAALIFFLRL